MYDISEYLPFEAFVMICIFVMGFIVCYGEGKENK